MLMHEMLALHRLMFTLWKFCMLNVSCNILMAIAKTETELHSFIHVSHNQVKQYSKSIHNINIIYMQVSKFTTWIAIPLPVYQSNILCSGSDKCQVLIFQIHNKWVITHSWLISKLILFVIFTLRVQGNYIMPLPSLLISHFC